MFSDKISRLKAYGLGASLMILFATLAMYLPQRNWATGPSDMYFGVPVSEASVQHEFFNDPGFNLQQLHGVKILDDQTGMFTYYFEYIANKQDTLRRIAALPFMKDNRRSSTACELMNELTNPLDNHSLTQAEQDATSFFWSASAEEFTFYECYKSPVKHTLLLSKTSNRILHKIEFV